MGNPKCGLHRGLPREGGIMKTTGRIGVLASLCLLLAWAATPSLLLAQNIQVTSANPPAAPQGTINLNVAIGGSGFKKGAKAAFYLSGTTNPDGVTVNSTTFNNSSQVTANINISDTANIANFDILVQTTDGRTGKGSQLFAVTATGTPVGCTTVGTPTGFSLVTTLNYVNPSGAPQYSGGFGGKVRVRPVTLTSGSQSRTVLVAAVTSQHGGQMEFFILDPSTGKVLDNTVIVGTHVQPHISVLFDSTSSGDTHIGAGDVNADGIPDFVLGHEGNNTAYVFVGTVDSNGILGYTLFTINAPASNPGAFGSGVAMGHLDGLAGDDVAIGATGASSRKSVTPGRVYIYQFNGSGFNLIGTVNSPNAASTGFSWNLAIGDVTGDGAPDLIVGDNSDNTLYVFPAPLSSSFSYSLTTGATASNTFLQVAAGHFSSSSATDVIATMSGTSGFEVAVFAGPITSSRTSPTFAFPPYSGLSTASWGTGFDAGDIDGDALGGVDIMVGVPLANNSNTCNVSVGAAEVYFSNPLNPSQPTLYVFQTPIINKDSGGFGHGLGAVTATPGNPPLLLVGENGYTFAGVTGAGQVYVYRKN